ncbi:MAG: glycosyltransferase family 39 protein, partial [Acidobacteriota bacterium]
MARVASPAVNPALRPRLRSATFISFLVITVSFVIMLGASWRRWLSPLTDSGREMDLPLRLLNGELLYRDIHYLYAPLSPYLNALLYRLFGIHLDVLQASGIAGAGIVIFLAFRIARRLLDPLDATVAVVCVLVWLVFKPYGNLISPYSYAALHATIFALGSLLYCLRFHQSSRISDLLIAATLTGLAAVTKLEFALPAAAAVATAVLITGSFRPSLFLKRSALA